MCIRSCGIDRATEKMRALTWAGTFEDLYPCPDSTIKMQLMQFQIRCQSSKPNCAFLGERLNYDVFCRWSNRPIAPPRLTQRMRYGKWIQGSCDLGKSRNTQWKIYWSSSRTYTVHTSPRFCSWQMRFHHSNCVAHTSSSLQIKGERRCTA